MAETSTRTPVDHLQDALEDLNRAREQAGEDVSASIDSARERITDASEELSDRGQGQLKDWREQFGSAADDALRELGRWAIRAQRSPEALTELSKEITKRKAEVGG
jgi:vacuolar-type H+-ATPase subunit H